jgi:hypothetical protein
MSAPGASGSATPASDAPPAIYFSVDGGAWMLQPTNAGMATVTLPPTAVGDHLLCTFAAFGAEGSSLVNPSAQSPFIDEISNLLFQVDAAGAR